MRSHTTESFEKLYDQLPEHIQKLADEAYELFKQDADYPSLDFKKRKGSSSSTYSVRIGAHYRALAIEKDGELYWYWIGSHEAYNKLK